MIRRTARRKPGRRLWANTLAATGWGESTYAEQAWDKSRSAATRWAGNRGGYDDPRAQ